MKVLLLILHKMCWPKITSLKNTEALIVFVHVKNYGEEALKPKTDNPPLAHGQIPADFSDFVMPEAYDKDYDNVIHVAKHNWGPFMEQI